MTQKKDAGYVPPKPPAKSINPNEHGYVTPKPPAKPPAKPGKK